MENKEDTDNNDTIDVPVIVAYETGDGELDADGYFVIALDTDRMLILAKHYSYRKELLRIIEGPDARSIYLTIIKYKWASTLNHAAYLGQELTKAEIAMKIGFGYVQG
ncbi:hypothetical protein V7O62_09205 [Methanolobus sp. ZRKC2]|uniref:DUF4346 domain-containing protein n=1 Tax=Methanolobus sp. ZRKC2 TaxID=3125783 RepID=UPI00325328A2